MDLQKFMKLVLRIGLHLLMGQIANGQLLRAQHPLASQASKKLAWDNYQQWLALSGATIEVINDEITNWKDI